MNELITKLEEICQEAEFRFDHTKYRHEDYWILFKQAELFVIMAKIIREQKNETNESN